MRLQASLHVQKKGLPSYFNSIRCDYRHNTCTGLEATPQISIPSGAITGSFVIFLVKKRTPFQFHQVRLQDAGNLKNAPIPFTFQFHQVRLQGAAVSPELRNLRNFNSIRCDYRHQQRGCHADRYAEFQFHQVRLQANDFAYADRVEYHFNSIRCDYRNPVAARIRFRSAYFKSIRCDYRSACRRYLWERFSYFNSIRCDYRYKVDMRFGPGFIKFQFHQVRLQVENGARMRAQQLVFQFHQVRLQDKEKDTRLSKSNKFQFHQVRLQVPTAVRITRKKIHFNSIRCDYRQAPIRAGCHRWRFQFHQVRLQAVRQTPPGGDQNEFQFHQVRLQACTRPG